MDLQKVINNHGKVFEEMSKCIPPNIRPYKYPHEKREIESVVVEIFKLSIIQPSQSASSSLIVMVIRKDGSWHIFLDYKQLKKMTIKYNFLIHIIDEFFDDMHGEIFFYKLDH